MIQKLVALSVFTIGIFASIQTYSEGQKNNDSLYVAKFDRTAVSEDNVKIFREILTAELAANGQTITTEKAMAAHLINGSISRLGDKILIVVKSFHTDSSAIEFVERVTIYNEEELDTVAQRLAKAFSERSSFSETVDITNVVEKEDEVKHLKKPLTGMTWEMGTFSPIGGDNYGEGESGVSLTIGVINETKTFFYQPSIGLRVGADNSYREIPLDISAGKLFSASGNSFYLAAGIGLRYVEEEVKVQSVSEGLVIRTVNQNFEESSFGGAGHLKAGYMFSRESAKRVLLSLRYDVSNADPLERDLAQAISLQIGVITF